MASYFSARHFSVQRFPCPAFFCSMAETVIYVVIEASNPKRACRIFVTLE
jgi:hypothetical protein